MSDTITSTISFLRQRLKEKLNFINNITKSRNNDFKLENIIHLGGSTYIVRTQAGYKKAVREQFGTREEIDRRHNVVPYPISYPSLVTLRLVYNGGGYLMKLDQFSLSELKDIVGRMEHPEYIKVPKKIVEEPADEFPNLVPGDACPHCGVAKLRHATIDCNMDDFRGTGYRFQAKDFMHILECNGTRRSEPCSIKTLGLKQAERNETALQEVEELIKKVSENKACGFCSDPTGMTVVSSPDKTEYLHGYIELSGVLRLRCKTCESEAVPEQFFEYNKKVIDKILS